MIKKILILLFCVSTLYAQDFLIETSKGPLVLTVPENLSIEEAYREMAMLYIEERYDLEEALLEIDKLIEEISEFIITSDQYIQENEKLRNDYYELILEYEEEIKPDFSSLILSLGAGIYPIGNVPYGSLVFGFELLESWILLSEVSYPFRLGFIVGKKW